MKEQKIIEKIKKLGVDIPVLLKSYKKEDRWKYVQGLLKKKPTGLQHQRAMREEWV